MSIAENKPTIPFPNIAPFRVSVHSHALSAQNIQALHLTNVQYFYMRDLILTSKVRSYSLHSGMLWNTPFGHRNYLNLRGNFADARPPR